MMSEMKVPSGTVVVMRGGNEVAAPSVAPVLLRECTIMMRIPIQCQVWFSAEAGALYKRFPEHPVL